MNGGSPSPSWGRDALPRDPASHMQKRFENAKGPIRWQRLTASKAQKCYAGSSKSRQLTPDARERVPTCTGGAAGRLNSPKKLARSGIFLVFRIAAQLLNIVLFAVTSPGQDAQNPSTAVTRGKEIYLYGTGYNGVPIEALAGEGSVKVPAAILRCVNCHGPDGMGKPEGGIYPSNIRWTELSKPYAITTGSGRERPPYNESLVIRAITMGIDSGGKRLDR